MRDQERLTRPVVVSLPAGIDTANAEHVGEQLRAAFAPAVIAEMGLMVFCCTFGSRRLMAPHKRAVSWLTNHEPEIGIAVAQIKRGKIAQAHCRASRRLCWLPACEPAPGSRLLISQR
jgi:hypothetical protein